MKAYVTRDSVAAGDDMEKHELRFDLPDNWQWGQVIDQVWRSSNLPQIAGGHATWVLSSGIPLAIAAQQWSQPQPLFLLESAKALLDIVAGEFRFHWSYLAQHDPDVVTNILRRLCLRAI